jgi:hypothetical protein
MPTDLTAMQIELANATRLFQAFGGVGLTRTLAGIESSLVSTQIDTCAVTLATAGVNAEVLGAAGRIKRLAGQVNVVIHALGILLCLPRILQPEEIVEYVSLGAGNTGKAFDLETNQRIAEFKFIQWRGGSEAIRQNGIFKDFYLMSEYPTEKHKFLYVLGREHPAKFLNGRRSLSSVLSHHSKLQKQFAEKYGEQYRTVREYYLPRKDDVFIEDILPLVPELNALPAESAELFEE